MSAASSSKIPIATPITSPDDSQKMKSEFPYRNDPTRRIVGKGWKESPKTMMIFWFGLYQILSLILGILVVVHQIFVGIALPLVLWMVAPQTTTLATTTSSSLSSVRMNLMSNIPEQDPSSTPTAILMMLVMILPVLFWNKGLDRVLVFIQKRIIQDVIIKRIVLLLVNYGLNTTYSYLLLQVFAFDDNAILHDGLPFGHGINILRAKYFHGEEQQQQQSSSSSSTNPKQRQSVVLESLVSTFATKIPSKDQYVYMVYPTHSEQDAWKYDPPRMEYTLPSWHLKPSSNQEIENMLQTKHACCKLHETSPVSYKENPHHAILYIHGGGFVAVNASVLLQQAVTMARGVGKNTVVYAMEYPLAPTYPFPTAIICALKCLQWLKCHRHVKHVTIVGDSAGGSLACYVATLVTSPKLLHKFWNHFVGEINLSYSHDTASNTENTPAHSSETNGNGCDNGSKHNTATCQINDDINEFLDEVPTIDGLITIYGVLDSSSDTFGKRLTTISWLEWKIAVSGLRFCMECYDNELKRLLLSKETTTMDPQRYFPKHIADLLSNSNTKDLIDFGQFPSTLFICGENDPLLPSTYKVMQQLHEHKQVKVQVHIAKGARHGFLGIPRVWMGESLRHEAALADHVVGTFLKDRHDQVVNEQ